MTSAELQQAVVAVAAIAEQVERAVRLAHCEAIAPHEAYEMLGKHTLIELP